MWIALLPLLACHRDDPDPGDTDTTALRLSGVLPGSPRSVDGPITRVVAVPHDQGDPRLDADSPPESAIAGDGSFVLELSPTLDWVLLLVDDDAGPTERIRGYVTLGTGQDALACLPLDRATTDLDLGQLEDRGDEAVGEVDPSAFTVDETTLVGLARTDEACKNLGNAWLNTDRDAGRSWLVQPEFTLVQDIARVPEGTAGPPFDLRGWVLHALARDARVSLPDLCAGTQQMELIPPATVRLQGPPMLPPTEIGPDRPLTTAGERFVAGTGCVAGDFNLSEDGDRLAFGTPTTGTLVDVVPGYWTLRVDGADIAWFDLGVTGALVDGVHPGPVPRLQAEADADGLLMGLQFTWAGWDGQSYADVSPDDLEELVSVSSVSLLAMTDPGVGMLQGDWVEHGQYADADVPGQRVLREVDLSALSPRWYAPDHPESASLGPLWLSAELRHDVAGVTVRTVWAAECTADADGDGWLDCFDCDDADPDANVGASCPGP